MGNYVSLGSRSGENSEFPAIKGIADSLLNIGRDISFLPTGISTVPDSIERIEGSLVETLRRGRAGSILIGSVLSDAGSALRNEALRALFDVADSLKKVGPWSSLRLQDTLMLTAGRLGLRSSNDAIIRRARGHYMRSAESSRVPMIRPPRELGIMYLRGLQQNLLDCILQYVMEAYRVGAEAGEAFLLLSPPAERLSKTANDYIRDDYEHLQRDLNTAVIHLESVWEASIEKSPRRSVEEGFYRG